MLPAMRPPRVARRALRFIPAARALRTLRFLKGLIVVLNATQRVPCAGALPIWFGYLDRARFTTSVGALSQHKR
jgi:hypothetical protein